MQAEQRADQRILDGHRRVVARSAVHEYVDEFAPATGPYREQVIARMAQRADEIAYWQGVYAQQQAAGIASSDSRDTIAKGDLVKHRGSWYRVMRVNLKTVSVQMHAGASWTNTIGYHEITGHQPSAANDADTRPVTAPPGPASLPTTGAGRALFFLRVGWRRRAPREPPNRPPRGGRNP